MVRVLLVAVAALLTTGADRASPVDYRLTVMPEASGPPLLGVEIRLRGDADGETRITLPGSANLEPSVSGATSSTSVAGQRVLRHRPGAKLTVRYRLRAPAAGTNALAAAADTVLAIPDGRADQAISFSWKRLPKGWRSVTDLDPRLTAHATQIADLSGAVLLAGPDLQVAERAIPGGVVRAAVFGRATDAARLAEISAPLVSAQRTFWTGASGPFLVALGFVTASGQTHNLRLPSDILTRSDPSDEIAQALTRAWMQRRLGGPSMNIGIVEGLVGVYVDRIRLRAGLLANSAAVSTFAMADTRRDAGSRGLIMALKWDEDIRRKSGGKLDLDDVVLRMRDHYQEFPPGQGPDVITGLISGAWVTAGIDLRPDIARYADGAAVIPLPETMFDGCLDARVTVAPGFDAGFDAPASFAAKAVRGVRRGGPAWNSGLRNGMILDSWTYTAGDMNREIELTVRAAAKRAKPRKARFWPYGDVDVETRKLQLAVGLSDAQTAVCARKIGGL